MPKLYQASTTILVEPQKVPSHYVQSLVTIPIEQRLNTITQQIMSRSRLLKIINELELANDNISPLALEAMIGGMQENIDIEVRGTSYFQIAYTGKNPRNVMLVTNKIASLFIEENLRVSERQARTTTKFISEELARVQAQLEAQEGKLQDFKQGHIGELPDQEEANLRALDRLQLRLQDIGQALRDTEEQEMLLQKQFLEEKPFLSLEESRQNPLLASLLALKEERDLLKTRYSDEWPRLKQIKQEIASLEGKLSEAEENNEEPAPETAIENPVYKALQQNLETTRRRIEGLKQTKAKLLQDITGYRRKVENIPKIEQQLISLTRDYEMTKSKYESLLDKKLEAKLSESLETKQKGETFKILDAAEIPLAPYQPKMLNIVALAICVGIGLGAGIVWLMETMDHSLKGIDDSNNYFGVSTIGLVSNIITPADIRRKRLKAFALLVSLSLYMMSVLWVVENKDQVKRYFSSLKSGTGVSLMSQKG